MWCRGFKYRKFIALVFALGVFKRCEAIKDPDFNSQIRDYSESENNANLSEVKTLQNSGLGHYASYAPAQDSTMFKDNYDNMNSGSSYTQLQHDYAGYGFEYEDPSLSHGYETPNYQPHDYHHYTPPAHHDYGHYKPDHYKPDHYKHDHYKHDHGLAHKALLWPIAGIALLGAAAALVTNPVLLQLGVVSGKRRRRHIENIENIAKTSIHKWSHITHDQNDSSNNIAKKVIKKMILSKNDFDKQVLQSGRDKIQFETINDPKRYSKEDQRYIPIPLKIKKT